jgi:hypothetical protein
MRLAALQLAASSFPYPLLLKTFSKLASDSMPDASTKPAFLQ